MFPVASDTFLLLLSKPLKGVAFERAPYDGNDSPMDYGDGPSPA
jgi:hypothetical protein